jgi:hypothetical protein
MTDKKKSQEQTNVKRNLRRKVKEDLRNVELWVKHYDIYNRWRELGILGSKTKDELRESLLQETSILVAQMFKECSLLLVMLMRNPQHQLHMRKPMMHKHQNDRNEKFNLGQKISY